MRAPSPALRTHATFPPLERAQFESAAHRIASHCDQGAEIAYKLELAIERSKRGPATDRGAVRQSIGQSRSNSIEIDRVCEAFAAVVDAKSPFTCSHSRGVAKVAAALATTLQLAPDRVQLVRRAALLHDLGKLAVPNAILDKSSKLTPAEWEVVMQHPQLTREILARIDSFAEIAEIAGAHHEKLDGTGYPQGLVASQLPIEARIIAVADIYQAMSEGRPYRPSMPHAEVMKVVSRLAPHKLDARCVDALEQMDVAKSARNLGFGLHSSRRREVQRQINISASPFRAIA